MTTESTRELRERSKSRHARLRELDERLLEFLERPRPEADTPEATDWAATLNRHLVDLHAQITAHFRDEQDQGVLSGLAVRYPQAAGRIETMVRAHDEILTDLRAIVAASMSYAEATTPPNPRLREWTRSLLEKIARHELDEITLIQDLVSTDIGDSG